MTFVLYAPNVHTGGGFVLLRALLLKWPETLSLIAFLDDRVRTQFPPLKTANVYWVKASICSRLYAELNLRMAAGAGSTVLCFHGLPPLLPNPACNIVFLQNRLHLEKNSISRFKLKTRVRLIFERCISRFFRYRVSEYIVQTHSMRRTVVNWYGDKLPPISVMPFMDDFHVPNFDPKASKEWDFIYVADGEAHKNHKNLLAAWQLLAEEGIYPSLALTLSSRDEALICEVEAACRQDGLKIQNLGHMSHQEVLTIYGRSGALIFPSTSESFGLPLIEAAKLNLPILASELDYVRDVCVPVQTFDPYSPLSIARAIKRFSGHPGSAIEMHTPAEFWGYLLGGMKK